MLTPETSTYASFDVPDLFYSGYADRKLALRSRAAWAKRGEQQGRQHCLAETLVPRAVRLGAGGCEGCGAITFVSPAGRAAPRPIRRGARRRGRGRKRLRGGGRFGRGTYLASM